MPRWNLIMAVITILALAVVAVTVRWYLFSIGRLYGATAAKMASLTVAAFMVVTCGLVLWIGWGRRRAATVPEGDGDSEPGPAPSLMTVVGSVAAILGLGTAAFSVSELVAPSTPFAAAQPACSGAPVYGAPYYALTLEHGANARSGPGREFPQHNRYGSNCTLGFDGYCIGPPESDVLIGSPDQRWLKVHQRSEYISAAVVLSQSPERSLGVGPLPSCRSHGGLRAPVILSSFSYDLRNGALSAKAPAAVAVGYGLAAPSAYNPLFHVGKLGTFDKGFAQTLPPATVGSLLGVTDGAVWLGATACLADNVPVTESLQVIELRLRGGKILTQGPALDFPKPLRLEMAENDCNSTG